MQMRSPTDFWSGLMFTVVGVGFAVGATNYSFGTSARPGPAYFPFGLGILLALLGAVILAKSFVGAAEEPSADGPIAWRPLGIVVAAIVMFGVALPLLGVVVTLPLLIGIVSLAGDQFRWRDVLLNATILTVGSWLVFIKGLQLMIPLWPVFIR